MTSNYDKAKLRREMKARRKELATDAKSAADAVICEKFKARLDIGEMVDPFNFGSPLAVYLASPDEINIDPYIEYMLHMGVKVVAPRWNGETYELARLKGLDEKFLRRGPMGIREPVDADIVEPQKVDAWIIPGLAFTHGGKRLGYGGGWYDRFLASAPKDSIKIGVAYSFQIVDDLPAEPHDIPLTDIVDDSLDDESLEFKETEDGFWAKITRKDRSRRVKTIAIFDSVKIWADGKDIPPCQPLVKTYARTALMLAIQINRANKWDDASYNAARKTRLANPPRGMKILSTDDGQGQVAVIRPFSPNISLSGVAGALFMLMLATFVLFIPYGGRGLGCIVASATLISCLFAILRGLFGCVKCEIKNGRMHYISGLWPFVRKSEISLDGLDDKVQSSGGDGLWWHDLLEHSDPFSWLPPKFRLPLRLFVEKAITVKNPARKTK